jgi:hypothetical protein
MHRTNTVDYSIIWDGKMWLELDDGKTVHLERGDVVVQNGTRHAWRNKGTRPATMLFFQTAQRSDARRSCGVLVTDTLLSLCSRSGISLATSRSLNKHPIKKLGA